ELVMGERRWRAAKAAGLAALSAIVRRTEDHDLLRDALLENLHRAQLNPLEEAAAYQQMLDDFDCTQEELSQRVKRSRPQISNTLRLLRLPPTVQRRVAAGVLSAGHARALLAVDDAPAQERLAQRVVAEGLSVRALEELVTLGELGEDRVPRLRGPREQPQRAVDVADDLSERFETRVKVAMGKKGGRITIQFASEEDLDRIVGLMGDAPEGPAAGRRVPTGSVAGVGRGILGQLVLVDDGGLLQLALHVVRRGPLRDERQERDGAGGHDEQQTLPGPLHAAAEVER